ncbi:hypothetical protein DJ62_3047 [Yersinia enterocolitica]|nr:hypothetical protein DJ62_3047 [Yersinia enterocolitica]
MSTLFRTGQVNKKGGVIPAFFAFKIIKSWIRKNYDKLVLILLFTPLQHCNNQLLE